MLLVVFVLFAAPFIHMFVETLDFVSPTRGFTVQGETTLGDVGFQQGVGVNLSSWTLLTDRAADYGGGIIGRQLYSTSKLLYAHWPMYIGAVATILCAYALVSLSIPWITVTAAILAFISLGPGTWLWGFMTTYVPLMSFLRHSFPFIGVVVFFFLILGASVIENQAPFRHKAVNLVLNYLLTILLLAIL